jgi:hypothetical protein
LAIAPLAAVRRRRWLAGAAALACAAAASGQTNPNHFLFEIDGDISPASPIATVRLYVRHESSSYAFAGTRLDVLASEPGWADLRLLEGGAGPGTTPGVIDGGAVRGVIAGQLHFPPAGIWSNPRNPIEIWEATFEVTDFSPRTIELATDASELWIYPERSLFVSGPVTFDQGASEIRVIPAPGAIVCLAPALLVAQRRRR